METRLTATMDRKKGIFSPIKELKLNTFTNVIKTGVAGAKAKHSYLKQSTDLLGRIFTVSQIHHIDPKDTLTYSLSDYPPALRLAMKDTLQRQTNPASVNIYKILCLAMMFFLEAH